MIDASGGLPSNGVDSGDLALESLFSEQVRAWMHGDRPPIKLLMDRHPGVIDNPNAVVELINQEVVLRQIRGETACAEDYLIDFPELAEPLSRLFEVHGALSIPPELRPSSDHGFRKGVTNLVRSEIASAPRIPGYEIEGTLGRGGMGVVYLARHRALDRIVALKVLQEGRQSEPEHRARFEREAAAVAKCQHPNLVQIHEIGEYDGQSYLALEYVDGGTLARSLAGVPQPPLAAAALVEILARAIDHAHSRGVVHRDLKPANVLLTSEGQPKITDFGLAKIDETTTRTEVGAIMGTLAYMAPEQALGGTAKVGPRADIYALGVILYEALTGRPPFRAESPELIYHQLVHSDAVPPSRIQTAVPRDLEAICMKCLEKSPAQRYATALELAEDLRRFERGDPIQARRISRLRRCLKWTRRHPWQTTAAATVVIAALAFIGMTYRHNVELRAQVRRTRDQAALARLNYQEARSAIQAMLGRLDNPRFAGSPRLLDLRHDQQEDALAFYDQVLRQTESNDPAVSADTARALNEGARLQTALGRIDLAEKYVRRSLQLVERVRSERPDDLGYNRLQVDCLARLAVYLTDSHVDQAKQFARQAVELAERLTTATRDDPIDLEQLAVCHNNYANTVRWESNDKALVHYQKAIEIRQRIDPVRLPGVSRKLAESLINLGIAFWRIQKYPAAEQSFRRADELLLSDDAKVLAPAEVVSFVGHVNVNWSGMLKAVGRCNEAIARADAGLSRLEPYCRLEPLDDLARDLCLKLHGNRANSLGATGRHREAADEWRRVVELSAQPVPARYRIFLAGELVHSGELDGALAQTKLVKTDSPIAGEEQYNLGCVFALLATAVRGNTQLLPEKRAPLVEARIADALRWLEGAATTGFFLDPAHRDWARKDPDFAILADRDEFRKLTGTDSGKP
jgi:tetratricopeptide (TPR) repeat protein/predicted Ser/Thr protein kinase